MTKGLKSKKIFQCSRCQYSTPKWMGRCPSCGEWETFEECGTSKSAPAAAAASNIQSLSEIREEQPQPDERLNTGISELNRVLGGGLVPDSFVLLGGDPGIGKSTLLLQVAKGLIETSKENKILYVSGEESPQQIGSRAQRLGLPVNEQLLLSTDTVLETVFESVKKIKPTVLMMDSLQTFATQTVESSPGSVSQVREVATALMNLAKTEGLSVWLVGHVTKEGNIAGPKMVEHMVDTVLYFEGDNSLNYRLLRTVKNRFGSTRELGVFEMFETGLKEVTNPSSLFLNSSSKSAPGTTVAACVEGTRPLLVEVQALVNRSYLAMPRRTSVGLDASRLALLAAILEKHLELPMGQHDLFFNVAGGIKISEPASDLAAAFAIWSSLQNIEISRDTLLIGELGLTGEVRTVSMIEARIAEGKKMGYKNFFVPQSQASGGTKGVAHVSELAQALS